MAEFDVEYDLVVVGGGASGKSAALIAARAGKNVVVIEKMPETGGLSVFAEGTAAFESSVQKELGTPRLSKYHFPTKQEGLDKIMGYSHQRANYEVARAFVENSAETIDIYRDLGVVYKTCDIAAEDDPNEVWTFHLPEGLGAHCQEVLLDAIQKLEVDIFTETPAKELIIEDGRVVGVVAESDGEPLRIGGKAVILATGGMGSSPDRIFKYSWFAPAAYNMNVLTPLQNVGDGLDLALSAGADPNTITTCPLLAAGGRDMTMDSQVGGAGVNPGVWINKTGHRFAAESVAENLGDIGTYYGKQPGGIVWSILSQADVDRLVSEGSEIAIGEFVVYHKPMTGLLPELEAHLESGLVKKADTFEELAEQMGVPTDAFVETMAAYNEACERGVDEAYFKKPQYLRALVEPPFYGIPLATGTMGSAGGIKVNGDMQVITSDGDAIPGLYAVGLDATGLYGDSYNMEIPGCANGFAHTSGRIAARHAIANM
ncbi:MAG: tetrahydrodaidzein reductase [Slackia sp.]|uniref:Succinate dehydrogenase n=1 Tax=Slackia isoflavoniconvertens TaxID=572010 RepID=M9P0B3_9ACTN|nr:tetrahydrodaidzein reductase [Slackia isoflavoniconvertens]AFV15450.1 tetrahydrodaidzein reductase [Slackia isoflavoniconvertens]MBB3279911.1 fumarate reductase flavoprotein subunit [Slackia isoflavoniconvertens]MDR4060200.1 tetrahydrodaidzein reductase [Slackia sp.]RNM33396.1 succinate dehydrogenase [Slackia isoflavoniconvertens]